MKNEKLLNSSLEFKLQTSNSQINGYLNKSLVSIIVKRILNGAFQLLKKNF